MKAVKERMSRLQRWQYVYLTLALLILGLAAIGYTITGPSVFSLYPTIVCIGLTIVVIRPLTFGYVMAVFGIVSLAIAGFLVRDGASPITIGVLVVVGIGALVGGIRTRRAGSISQ